MPKLSEPIPEEVSAREPAEGKDEVRELLKGGHYHIIPSFFSMMRALKKAKREFAIIFRTMGSDLGKVIAEFNA